MITTVTHTRRPLWLVLLKPIAIWRLTRRLRGEERYLDQLRSGGVFTPAMLAARNRNLGPIRTLLAWWRSA